MNQGQLKLALTTGPEVPPGWENDPLIQRIPPGTLLVVSDVANAFNVTPNTVLEWIATGELPATNVGATAKPFWKILRRDLIAFRIARHSLSSQQGRARSPNAPEQQKKGTSP